MVNASQHEPMATDATWLAYVAIPLPHASRHAKEGPTTVGLRRDTEDCLDDVNHRFLLSRENVRLPQNGKSNTDIKYSIEK